jgi:aspartyl aminopeptidase
MPSLNIIGHRLERLERTQSNYEHKPDGIAILKVEDVHLTEELTVIAAVLDAPIEDMHPRRRSNRRHRIQQVRVVTVATGGGEWETRWWSTDSTAHGTGVMANGSDGAETQLRRYDWPAWLLELVDEHVRAWIKEEYPRG